MELYTVSGETQTSQWDPKLAECLTLALAGHEQELMLSVKLPDTFPWLKIFQRGSSRGIQPATCPFSPVPHTFPRLGDSGLEKVWGAVATPLLPFLGSGIRGVAGKDSIFPQTGDTQVEEWVGSL